MAKRRRIPKRVVLPLGVVISVVQVSPCHEYLITENGTYADGIWDPAAHRIAIDKTLPMKRRKKILYHELIHCINDVIHELEDDGMIQS